MSLTQPQRKICMKVNKGLETLVKKSMQGYLSNRVKDVTIHWLEQQGDDVKMSLEIQFNDDTFKFINHTFVY